jgi:hypothetical protein
MWNKFRMSPRGYLKSYVNSPKLDDADSQDIKNLSTMCSREILKIRNKPVRQRTIVILSFLPLPYVVKMEGLLGRFLAERGWTVKLLSNASAEYMTKPYHQQVYGFNVDLIEEFISFKNSTEIDEIINRILFSPAFSVATLKQLIWRQVPVGIHALATFLSGTPEGRFSVSRQSMTQLQRILRRSMLYVDAANLFFDQNPADLVLGMEKGFVGTCEIFYVALCRNISYVQWVGCHEPDSIMFKRYNWSTRREHPFSICERDWSDIKEIPWNDLYRVNVLNKFEAGYKNGDWFRYKSLTSEQNFAAKEELIKSLYLDVNKKTVVIYSHILSDANLFYGDDIFLHGYEEWLVETVRAASKNMAVNWVLKLHPANRVRNLRMGYSGEYGEIQALRNAFGELPAFLHIVYPEDKVSPMSFFQISDCGITVRGTVGIELPCFGVPILTAGTGRYSGKGFTCDSESIDEYLNRIRTIHEIKPLSLAQTRLAQMYAYFVFKGRPAKYDKILADKYEYGDTHTRYRDFEFKLTSLAATAEHPQMRAILDFLEDETREDFLDFTEIPVRLHAR